MDEVISDFLNEGVQDDSGEFDEPKILTDFYIVGKFTNGTNTFLVSGVSENTDFVTQMGLAHFGIHSANNRMCS